MTVPIWETGLSHDTQENHEIIRIDCAVTIRVHSPRYDACLEPTKQCLFKKMC